MKGVDIRLEEWRSRHEALEVEYTKVKQERDELLKRAADLSWEKMSPREQAVWAAAFGARRTTGELPSHSAWRANEAVEALRKALK